MGRGNRRKKKTNNIDVLDLLDDINKNQFSGEFSYSQCVTNPKKNNRNKKKTESSCSNFDSNKNNTQLNKNVKENVNSKYSEESLPKINFFDKNDNELELFEKRMMVELFVNRYWNQICVCDPIENIIIEDDKENDTDEYFNEEY